jgi:hypothetical protein
VVLSEKKTVPSAIHGKERLVRVLLIPRMNRSLLFHEEEEDA